MLLGLRESHADLVDLQVVAFPQEGILQSPGTEDLLVEGLRAGADVVGGCSYMEATPEECRDHVDRVFALAERFGVPVDLHADFADDTSDPRYALAGYIADRTRAHGMAGRVTVGHMTSLASLGADARKRTVADLADAGVAVVVLPATDVHLGGRSDDANVRRGIAPVRDLLDAGVRTGLSSNNIRNGFTPFGNADVLEIALFLAQTAHLGGPDDLATLIRMATDDAARNPRDRRRVRPARRRRRRPRPAGRAHRHRRPAGPRAPPRRDQAWPRRRDHRAHHAGVPLRDREAPTATTSAAGSAPSAGRPRRAPGPESASSPAGRPVATSSSSPIGPRTSGPSPRAQSASVATARTPANRFFVPHTGLPQQASITSSTRSTGIGRTSPRGRVMSWPWTRMSSSGSVGPLRPEPVRVVGRGAQPLEQRRRAHGGGALAGLPVEHGVHVAPGPGDLDQQGQRLLLDREGQVREDVVRGPRPAERRGRPGGVVEGLELVGEVAALRRHVGQELVDVAALGGSHGGLPLGSGSLGRWTVAGVGTHRASANRRRGRAISR